MRLAPPGAVLAIAEGIETALSCKLLAVAMRLGQQSQQAA